jgi:hypothetical protein
MKKELGRISAKSLAILSLEVAKTFSTFLIQKCWMEAQSIQTFLNSLLRSGNKLRGSVLLKILRP